MRLVWASKCATLVKSVEPDVKRGFDHDRGTKPKLAALLGELTSFFTVEPLI